VKRLLQLLNAKQFAGLDIQKLKGRDDIYHVRKGSLRIIYRVTVSNKIFILAIERRSDTTYNFKPTDY